MRQWRTLAAADELSRSGYLCKFGCRRYAADPENIQVLDDRGGAIALEIAHAGADAARASAAAEGRRTDQPGDFVGSRSRGKVRSSWIVPSVL